MAFGVGAGFLGEVVGRELDDGRCGVEDDCRRFLRGGGVS